MPETNTTSRALHIPNLHNARDLGGLPTRDGRTTRWRSLLRADDLHHLTPDGLQALHDYGVETVLDLLPFTCSAWLEGDPVTFKAPSASMAVKDQRGRVVLLFQDALMKSIGRERNPNHVLKDMG